MESNAAPNRQHCCTDVSHGAFQADSSETVTVPRLLAEYSHSESQIPESGYKPAILNRGDVSAPATLFLLVFLDFQKFPDSLFCVTCLVSNRTIHNSLQHYLKLFLDDTADSAVAIGQGHFQRARQ